MERLPDLPSPLLDRNSLTRLADDLPDRCIGRFERPARPGLQPKLADRLAVLIDQNRVRLAAGEEMPLAPLAQADDDVEQVAALLRQPVFLIGAAVRRRHDLEHA